MRIRASVRGESLVPVWSYVGRPLATRVSISPFEFQRVSVYIREGGGGREGVEGDREGREEGGSGEGGGREGGR